MSGRALLAVLFLAAAAAPARAEGPSRRERLRWAAEAKTLAAGKKHEAAAQALERAVSPGASKGDQAAWWPLLGRCYEATRNYPKALTAYQKAHDLRPKSLERMQDLARLYALVDLNDQAVVLYGKILKKDRRRKDVMYALAAAYGRAGRLDEAKATAEKYLEWEPRDTVAQRLLAGVEESLGDLPAAAHRWEGVLAVEPDAERYFDLGRLWARQGQLELAENAFRNAESLGDASSALAVERGLMAWRRADLAAAAAFWDRARREDPAAALPGFLLALADFQRGRTAEAVEGMRRVEKDGAGVVKDLAAVYLATAPGAAAVAGERR